MYICVDVSYQNAAGQTKQPGYSLATGQAKITEAVKLYLAVCLKISNSTVKMLTCHFDTALPVSTYKLQKQYYHGFLPLCCHLGNTKLCPLVAWPTKPASYK